MKFIHDLRPLVTLVAALSLGLGACAAPSGPSYSSGREPINNGNAYATTGTVQAIELTKSQGTGIGLGAVTGAVVGGLLGNQVGSGSGKKAATIAGAAGGAYVGHELQKQNSQTADTYRITVRMDDGTTQSRTQGYVANLRVGDRVRVGRSDVQPY